MGDSDLPLPRLNLEESQSFGAVRKPLLLSAEEIDSVHDLAARVGPRCGFRARKDADGACRWSTRYLSTDRQFQDQLPALHEKLIQCAMEANADHFHVVTGDDIHLRTRCIEYHEVLAGGKLDCVQHYDAGSLFTIDVMLSEPGDDFDGGDFVGNGIVEPAQAFEKRGDAIVFVSHMYHSVKPVVRGLRRVLVMELWEGEERQCGHRCEHANGPCNVRPVATVLENALNEFPEEDREAAKRFLSKSARIL